MPFYNGDLRFIYGHDPTASSDPSWSVLDLLFWFVGAQARRYLWRAHRVRRYRYHLPFPIFNKFSAIPDLDRVTIFLT